MKKEEQEEELWALQDENNQTFSLCHGTMLEALKQARFIMQKEKKCVSIVRA